ncbi:MULTISPECIES: hypothetical protein [unclassified Endozoicomonas]|uniref:hypothetical protein n=1 Tax=unclassified Endozoicomonas TaxID=2644528 RepID=UPI002148A3F3|nr:MULTISPECIES: hypothetical protein [unclassified Endozoicomonas]
MKKMTVNLIITLLLSGQSAFGAEKQDDDEHQFYITDYLKTGVAWGLIPLGSEVAVSSLEHYLKSYKSDFLGKLLDIHKNNVQRAMSQHLTDNISARLESISYKALSDSHVTKKTDELQTDLLYRSLSTFSILSFHAQKARKTYFRLLDIIDTVSSSASLAMARGDEDTAAALMAFNAQSMVYLHPETKALDVFDSVYDSFSRAIDWRKHSGFRSRITYYLKAMDPLMKQSAIMGLRYCNILNQWKVSNVDCHQYENEAIDELKVLASNSNTGETGFIKSLLKNVSKDQIRNSIFILGVSVPGTFLYFVDKQHPAVIAIAKHFSKIVGLSTTKENMERFASQSRRSLENWGAINTGSSVNRTSGISEYTNQYFSTLQKKAGMILAEQPNFARSNSQRALEILIIHFADAYRTPSEKSRILAGALVQNYREIVEVNAGDTLMRSLLLAYQPLKSASEVNEIYKQVEILDPHCFDFEGYKKLAESWAKASLDDVKSVASHSKITNNQTDSCPAEGCPPEEINRPEEDSPFYYHYLPDRETVATATIHGAALGYSLITALIKPLTIKKLTPKASGLYRVEKTEPFWQVASYYFLLSMIEFGLRSVGEPAIVHLQTVVKNWIGSTTGILDPEDQEIQNELAAKVNVVHRKLSIEAQTSRSYKMTMEAMLVKCWLLASTLLTNQEKNYTDSARVVAYSAYVLRYYHPEFKTSSTVISALANARLGSALNQLRQKNLMPLYAKQVLLHLAELDSDYADKTIKASYLDILNNWGIECDQEDTEYAQDVLDSWAVYGEYMLGITGFVVQASLKAYFHYADLVSRSIVNFLANIFEFGTTDPLRKRIYAHSRKAMLNVAASHSQHEQMAADYANEELTQSFRRQKFYLGKPELDARTQLVQIITSVIHCFSEARFLIADDETEKATDLIASGLVRVILYAPDLSGNDIHLKKALITLTASYRDDLNDLSENILNKVSEQLKSKAPVDSDIYSDGMIKAKIMEQAWSMPEEGES